MNLGNCSITCAEMRGAIEGLHRCWEAGYRNVVLQLDSIATLTLLQNDNSTNHQHGMESLLFRELRDRDWTVITKHTYREGNHAVDYLASMGYNYPLGSHSNSSSDCNLAYFLHYDCLGVSVPHLIMIND
ncbi:Putative ribonuclease H protein At1g65750 [Linum perenne]